MSGSVQAVLDGSKDVTQSPLGVAGTPPPLCNEQNFFSSPKLEISSTGKFLVS